MKEKIKKIKTLLHFDNVMRAKILGYNSVHYLYRNISCDRFVSGISIPFLVLHSKDDPICPTSNIPMTDLLKNPNCLII